MHKKNVVYFLYNSKHTFGFASQVGLANNWGKMNIKKWQLPRFTSTPAKFILIVHKHIRSCKAPARPEKAQMHCKP